MAKTIYLAGQVSGIPFDVAHRRFALKQEQLQAQGFHVLNPTEMAVRFNWASKQWEEIMRICIQLVCLADEVHLLPCWQKSRGAMLERDTALRLGIPVIYHH